MLRIICIRLGLKGTNLSKLNLLCKGKWEQAHAPLLVEENVLIIMKNCGKIKPHQTTCTQNHHRRWSSIHDSTTTGPICPINSGVSGHRSVKVVNLRALPRIQFSPDTSAPTPPYCNHSSPLQMGIRGRETEREEAQGCKDRERGREREKWRDCEKDGEIT